MLNVLIGAGHSGVINGHYFTPGKRSPGKRTPKDKGIFEGGFNREVAGQLWVECMVDDNIFGKFINRGPIAIPLKTKAAFINWYHKLEPNTIYIEIHANAIGNAWQKRVHGSVVFHKNQPDEKTRRLAECIEKALRTEPTLEIQSRGIKTAEMIGRGSFSILELPTCPSIIVECGSMDHPDEVELLAMPRVQGILAGTIHAGAKEYGHEEVN